MNVDFGWKGEASGLEHSGPEKGMKIGDVFSNEMVDFTSVVVPPIVKGFTMVVAPLESMRYSQSVRRTRHTNTGQDGLEFQSQSRVQDVKYPSP